MQRHVVGRLVGAKVPSTDDEVLDRENADEDG